ncbi:hypothetical protein ACSBR1_023036 [Camellia fascicularis]
MINEPVSDSKKTPHSANFDHDQNSLIPSSLSFPAAPKFEVDGDVEIQSPDNSLWESLFSDLLEGDFMISSPPVRNMASPQASNFNYSYNSAQSSLMRYSPNRISSHTNSSSTQKGKGLLSPLHRVFNSPNNQYMQPSESLLLPALENFLDDFNQRDEDLIGFPTTIKSSSESECYDTLDWLTVPSSSSSLRYSGSVNERSGSGGGGGGSGSQLTLESEIYHNHHQVGSLETAPLLLQLQQEWLQERQQQQQQPPPRQQQVQPHNINHGMVVPPPIGPEQEQDSGLQLVHLLLVCVESISKKDYMSARRYLHHLNQLVTPLGDSMQRVASCFTEALSARLASTLTKPNPNPNPNPTPTQAPPFFTIFPSNSLEILKIYQILYQACPYVKFAHFTANQAILETFEAEDRVHIIDLDILQGYQWPAFMQALAARPGGPPFLRITGVSPLPELVRETGRCLTELAHSLHVPFEFHPISEQLEELKPHMFNRHVGEALAVNSVNCLHRVPANSLQNLLAMIRDQAPNIVTVVEREANHNGTYFLGRFLEALHYYSAVFDSLDATFPAESAQRAKVEQYIFAPEIRNIVACEGAERVIRHERLEKWRKIMEGKGFKGVALSANALNQSEILLGLYNCDGYRLKVDNGCLLLGWLDRAILAASAWRC